MVTPLRGRDELDLPGLERLIEHILTRILHKPVEQMGGRGVRKLENSELYDNQLRRPEPNRL